MKKLCLLCMIFSGMLLFSAEFRVRGKVSLPNARGVSVCDGENFHPVNADGSFDFKFSTEGTGFVYVDYPSTLKPQGKWSAALKPGDNQVNFTLVKQGSIPETFTFVHGSDVQYNFKAKRAELANDMAEVAGVMKSAGAHFITFPGDLSEFGEADQLAILRGEFVKNKLNYFAFFGGHDRLKSKPSYKNFTECFGAPYFGWNFGGIYFFSPVSEYNSLPELHARQRQVRWMKNALSRLAPGTPVMVVTHQPWYVFDFVESFAKSGKIKLLGFLGAHTHYHNYYEYHKYPVFCGSVLRAHDTGSFTKRLCLVTINKNGIVSTSTRLLNAFRRIEPTVCNGDQLLVRVADTVNEAISVSVAVNGKTIQLKKLNQLVWGGTLPAKITSAPAVVTVKTVDGEYRKNVKLVNIPKLAWCSVLPFFQRSYPEAVIQSGLVITGVESGELPAGNGGVAAFDLASGKQVWYYRGNDVASGVAADDKTVRAIDVNGNLLTLELRTGNLIRSTAIPRNSMYFRTHANVTLTEGKVLVAYTGSSKASLMCYDAATDAPVWKKPINLNSAWDSVNYTVHNGVVYYSGSGCNGAARLADGVDIWRRHDGAKPSAGNPLIHDGAVYFFLRSLIVKNDLATGKPLWIQNGVPGSTRTIGGLCVKDGRLLSVSTNALIVSDAATGKRFYRRNIQVLHPSRGMKFQFLVNTAEPVIWKDRVLVLADDGAVYDLASHMAKCNNKQDADRMVPDKLFETGFAFKGDPVISGDYAVFIGFDGVVYALKY